MQGRDVALKNNSQSFCVYVNALNGLKQEEGKGAYSVWLD